jgi:hypothetical protein
MRTSFLWATTWTALAGGALLMLVGLVSGSELGSMFAGYGLLIALAAAYLGAGLAIRDRVRAATATRQDRVDAPSLLGRRVF